PTWLSSLSRRYTLHPIRAHVRPKAAHLAGSAPGWCFRVHLTSEHGPGCLRLCVGTPVMIKSNDAPELCITKGQEAIVRG
ncbi:hypothetical protein B0H19DRAFT_1325418, partial [Mycena capillaripes]